MIILIEINVEGVSLEMYEKGFYIWTKSEGGTTAKYRQILDTFNRGHGGRVVTLSPPTSEAGVRSPARPQVGKLVVACRWWAVYSTEP